MLAWLGDSFSLNELETNDTYYGLLCSDTFVVHDSWLVVGMEFIVSETITIIKS